MLKEIIKGCRNRNRKSQKELYRMYYAYGMSIALRYVGSRDEAAEVLNDAYMKVFDKIRKYDMDRPFKPWLRRIVINTAINHFHKNEKSSEWEQLETASPKMAVEETVTSGISYQEIIGMIQSLTPAYRTVFNLHVIEGFQHKEIAAMLGIAVGTSKSNLAKAKRNLQALLEKNLIQ